MMDERLKGRRQELVEKLRFTKPGSLSSYAAGLLKPFLEVGVDTIQTPSGIEEYEYQPSLAADRRDLQANLIISTGCRRDSLYYREKTKLLVPILRNTVQSVVTISVERYVSNHWEILRWVCTTKEEIIRCIKDGCSSDSELNRCSLLCLCCILERSLRDLLLQFTRSCPHLLKDIISHRKLEELLGCTIVALLDMVVGPPISLNIRNLAWHGFQPAEGHFRHCALLILYTMLQVGDVLADQEIQVTHMPFITLDANALCHRHAAVMSGANLDSAVVLSDGIGSIRSDITAANSLAQTHGFGRAVCVLLTSFEHFLRVTFCVLNAEPDRLTTAESSEYFTTLDHVLEEFRADGSENILFHLLPDRLRTAIFDMLLYPEGLRLRDRLSHMELSYLDIPQCIWFFLCNVVTTTAVIITQAEPSTDIEMYLSCSYEPVYHPLTRVVNGVSTLTASLTRVNLPLCVEMVHGHAECRVDVDLERLIRYFDVAPDEVSQVHVSLFGRDKNSRNLSIPSQFTAVSELLKLVRDICKALYDTAVCLREFALTRYSMYADQCLRSRQRKNYQCFLQHYNRIMQLVTSLTAIATRLINGLEGGRCKVVRNHKLLLKMAENLRSLALSSKWCQCLDDLGRIVSQRFL